MPKYNRKPGFVYARKFDPAEGEWRPAPRVPGVEEWTIDPRIRRRRVPGSGFYRYYIYFGSSIAPGDYIVEKQSGPERVPYWTFESEYEPAEKRRRVRS